MHGSGYYYKKDGDNLEIFSGDMRDGKKYGFGKLSYPQTEETYKGDFRDDKYFGYGKLEGSFGTYEGDFREGLMWGKGILNKSNGEHYDG